MKQIKYEEIPQGVKVPLLNQNALILDGRVTQCLQRVGNGYSLVTTEDPITGYPPFIYPDKMFYSRVDIIELHSAKTNNNLDKIHNQLINCAITNGYSNIAQLMQELNNDSLLNNIIIHLNGTYCCVNPNFFIYGCFLKGITTVRK